MVLYLRGIRGLYDRRMFKRRVTREGWIDEDALERIYNIMQKHYNVITEEVDEMITHNIFYTAITRTKNMLKIYWSPESQEKIINAFEKVDISNEATIFATQIGLRRVKNKKSF